MQWTIPGTTLKDNRENADQISVMMQNLFLSGGLTLSQVSKITGIEPYTIQNWIKRGFLSSPKGKRYDMEQVCRIININILKGAMPLEQIIHLMKYLNGDLINEADDLVDDTQLFFFFTRLAARARYIGGSENWDEVLEEITQEYKQRQIGAREKLIKVLKIMLTVWVANRLRTEADLMIRQLNDKTM